MIYDISPLIDSCTAVWPGDVKLSRQMLCDIAVGDNYTLSSIHTTVHIGAHADAPSHYTKNGKSISECSLAPYLGKCQVIRCDIGRAETIKPEHISIAISAPRVLFYTGTAPISAQWNNDFAAFSVELIEFLAQNKCILVGIDTPSVDLVDSKDLVVHKSIAKYEMAILEGLDLSSVPEGIYELIALPLKLNKFDASPVRAVLVTIEDNDQTCK